MKKWFQMTLLACMSILLFTACGNGATTPPSTGDDELGQIEKGEKLKVVTSFTIIADLAREIGGDEVDVYNLVPTGTDPHEYEPLPEDNKRVTDADILFYNGLNLEGGKDGWFFKTIEAVGQKEENVFSLTEKVEPMYISSEDGQEEEINPHAFLDPHVGILMAEAMRDAFMQVDTDNKEKYQQRGNEYIERLKEVEEQYAEKLGAIPKEKRFLVTSERAFQYLADRYDLEEGYIWAIDTEENGSPQQIKSLVSFLHENQVPILFVESNVDKRPMETVSKESGVPIYEKPIYSDEIGKPGDEVDTYMKYLNYNLDVLANGLSQS
ncbi:zinc ABC transporter substrate-binding protein [Ammoniphilus oxalaticus]|uniref:Zinc ABC transporter substrate-binding protein n=1 Tax=Ammoniphilus oxalaticus TaxID=66863 RepID=A0A419SM10_9BACL|nr:zinc ABC transporter substrate-binding protein [Ammoniphilus oxalaticus]RKD25110.1 zinc ABC transporter substrate-binding protein [Ammoniphilus oxalaticus]